MIFQTRDQRIFKKLVDYLDRKKNLESSRGNMIIETGKFFLGAPYIISPLDTGISERLVINLSKFDCMTFIEQVMALVCCLQTKRKSFKDFQRILLKIRYRDGQLRGYSSRLHYFSDWIHDNQKKGILSDITEQIGGKPWRKKINFMTTHPELYPLVKNKIILQEMKSVEIAISRRCNFFIPSDDFKYAEKQIFDGDIVAFTTNREGLDVGHVGFAIRVKNRIHLLHASKKGGKVIMSKETLSHFLKKSLIHTGIMVARLRVNPNI